MFKYSTGLPDLNPIENLWGILVFNIFRKVPIRDAWKEVTADQIKSLVDRMEKRSFDVLKKVGSYVLINKFLVFWYIFI